MKEKELLDSALEYNYQQDLDTIKDHICKLRFISISSVNMLEEKDKEIERLNNIINELEKFIKDDIISNLCEIENKRIGYGQTEVDKIWLHNLWGFKKYIVNKYEELKGSDKE